MELKAGAYYKTRAGFKAFGIGWNEDHTKFYYDVKYDVIHSGWCNEEGYWLGEDCKWHDDIIEEWKEPKRIKVWVNVWYKNGDVKFTATDVKDESDRESVNLFFIDSFGSPFARFSYEVTEGDGL